MRGLKYDDLVKKKRMEKGLVNSVSLRSVRTIKAQILTFKIRVTDDIDSLSVRIVL